MELSTSFSSYLEHLSQSYNLVLHDWCSAMPGVAIHFHDIHRLRILDHAHVLQENSNPRIPYKKAGQTMALKVERSIKYPDPCN
jgi:hypothetical protein